MEDTHDNNVCDTDEELYAELCYKQCRLLTNGSYPIRTSSWTCCERHPCGLLNQKGKVGSTFVCNGFDVDRTGRCPHKPGACLVNEEFFLGTCYKQCQLLTQGRFPNRVGPATCCMSNDLLGCLDIRNDVTRAAYNVGGGAGDHDSSTPGESHAPILNLTEIMPSTPITFAPATLAPGTGGHSAVSVFGKGRCEANEELYAGLCYKRCELLTAGQYPIRTSSWTCCASHPCGLSNQKGALGRAMVCNGFDVGGAGAIKFGDDFPCPHAPSSCTPEEEEAFGFCYKKCSILTDGKFPYRLTAATCCAEAHLRACLDIRKVETSSAFNVGAAAATLSPITLDME